MSTPRYIEIETAGDFFAIARQGCTLQHYAFQGIDFDTLSRQMRCTYDDCIFMGCNIPDDMRESICCNCIILPRVEAPYAVFPSRLYTAATLYHGYDPHNAATLDNCYDTRVYRHYIAQGKNAADIRETLCRTLHDHSISDALHDLLSQHDERDVIAIMGGHSLLRTDPTYLTVARIARTLTERGLLVVSGGGPGAMEATHLGAYMAHRPDSDLVDTIGFLSQAPSFHHAQWLATAFEVMKRYPRVADTHDIGVPTWFYGHEPATPFAAHIAKYFDNSIREDGLLTIAKGGVIFAPGSAGTMQEIFQDAAQNHYCTHGYASPMIFLGSQYWSHHMPVYPLLQELLTDGRYHNLILTLTDSENEVVQALQK